MLHLVPVEFAPIELPLLLVRTPAGFPSPAQDDMEEPIDLAAWLVEHPAASYIMRVEGNSMVGTGIFDGDYIVVSRAKKPTAGKIVVALVHGERTLKRLRRRGGRRASPCPDLNDLRGRFVRRRRLHSRRQRMNRWQVA